MRNSTTDDLGTYLTKEINKKGLVEVQQELDAFDIPNKATFHFIHNSAIVTAYCHDDTWYCKY